MLACHHVSRQRTGIKQINSHIHAYHLRPRHSDRSRRNDRSVTYTTTDQIFYSSKPLSTLRRNYSTSRDIEHVGILGGGITGLACAYFLSQDLPNAKITLFEKSDELGGWIRSTRRETEDGEILWEQGPRSLRPHPPNGLLGLRLAQELDLVQSIRWIDNSSSAARNRFIYYPDHLVLMPSAGRRWSNIRTTLTEPVFSGTISGFFREVFSEKRSDSLTDESIGSFLTRRSRDGGRMANNLASALVHGIYAGDIHQLSTKSLLPQLWVNENKYGSVFEGIFQRIINKDSWNFCDDIELQHNLKDVKWDPILKDSIPRMSVYYFKEGMATLCQALEKKLSVSPNVRILKSTSVYSLKRNDANALSLEYGQGCEMRTAEMSHVISTLPSNALVDITAPLAKTGELAEYPKLRNIMTETPAVTVGVVNLYYQEQDLLRKLRPPNGLPPAISKEGLSGFGYLIPNSVPLDQNPEFALGVIFDSDVTPEHWTTVPPEKLGTRLTVMLGGHYWDGWAIHPAEEDLKEMAMSVLARHLGLVQLPLASQAKIQNQCIPQYAVGHHGRMSKAHDALLDLYDGRVRVAGSWYTGVGINDCLRSAWDVVKGMQPGSAPGQRRSHERTGLEHFSWGRPMMKMRRLPGGNIDVVEVENNAIERGYLDGLLKNEKEDRNGK